MIDRKVCHANIVHPLYSLFLNENDKQTKIYEYETNLHDEV